MAPPAKKQKTTDAPQAKSPIIFKSPGMKVEISLKVFTQEFHVSPMALKLNSGFFRTFLEPSGGIAPPRSTRAGFTSEWFTKVDENGTWALTSDHKFRNTTGNQFNGDPSHEERAFEKLLCAIYVNQYQLTDVKELLTIADMASYYNATAIVSSSIYSAIMKSPSFKSDLLVDPCQALIAAKTLMNEDLFREGLILSLGPWSNPRFLKLKDHVLKSSIINIFLMRCYDIEKAHRDIQALLAREYFLSNQSSSIASNVMTLVFESMTAHDINSPVSAMNSAEMHLPEFFRKILEPKNTKLASSSVQRILGPLLANDLKLISDDSSGIGQFADYFLFLTPAEWTLILPWDTTED